MKSRFIIPKTFSHLISGHFVFYFKKSSIRCYTQNEITILLSRTIHFRGNIDQRNVVMAGYRNNKFGRTGCDNDVCDRLWVRPRMYTRNNPGDMLGRKLVHIRILSNIHIHVCLCG